MNSVVNRLTRLVQSMMGGESDPEHPEMDALIQDIEEHVLARVNYIYANTRLPFKGCDAYEALKQKPAEFKIEFLLHLLTCINAYKGERSFAYNDKQYKRHHVRTNLLDALLRTRIDFPQTFSFYQLFKVFYAIGSASRRPLSVTERPFAALVMQIEKHVKRHGLSEPLVSDLHKILEYKDVARHLNGGSQRGYWGPDVVKAAQKLQRVLLDAGADAGQGVPVYELGSGPFGALVKADLEGMTQEECAGWYRLFHHLNTASAGKPSQKFLGTAKELVDAIGTRPFKLRTARWLQAAADMVVRETESTYQHQGQAYTYSEHEYIESHSFNLLKGLLWSLSRFHDAQTLKVIAQLTEKCFQKVPGQGPAAASVGNAAIYALAESKGLDGISHLSRLKLRIRQNNTQKLIQKYIDQQAARQGLKSAQIEEIAAPDFGMVAGERVEAFDDYRLVLRHTRVGAAELQWLKPDGKVQKSVPAFVKDSAKHAGKMKKMRDLVKQVKQASTAQRDRIDRLYLEDMCWTADAFDRYYLHHGLVGCIARKLIWTLDGTPALYHDGNWHDVSGKPIATETPGEIRFWHPIDSSADEVLQWRDRLETLEISQPIKQAFREVYVLTDAEINTRVYSNRMAAHILKQHQFNSLAALRGWKYSLLGAYDDGRDGEIASKPLTAHGLEAQFWINEIIDDTDSFNDAGIWYYVATDQLRFCREGDDQPVPMVDIPPLVLSEIMRDLDLFVGVASVGNDPQWQDGGPDARPDYRAYWHSYSFGDLTEVAKTRKTVLERLLPRLKIRDKARIEGKFLFVDGTRHTYKIHIGSGNILICPNDRYLCIVPGRGKDRNVGQVFLPFEGDNGLSIVLSKAFMLADDDKITDPTILSQL